MVARKGREQEERIWTSLKDLLEEASHPDNRARVIRPTEQLGGSTHLWARFQLSDTEQD